MPERKEPNRTRSQLWALSAVLLENSAEIENHSFQNQADMVPGQDPLTSSTGSEKLLHLPDFGFFTWKPGAVMPASQTRSSVWTGPGALTAGPQYPTAVTTVPLVLRGAPATLHLPPGTAAGQKAHHPRTVPINGIHTCFQI